VLSFFILHIIVVAVSTNLKRIGKVAPVHKRKHNSHELDVKIDIIRHNQSGEQVTDTAQNLYNMPFKTCNRSVEDCTISP
jgi:hypothetical protein